MISAGMEEILPGLFRWVSRCHGPRHPVNSYLWRSPSGSILIDPAADFPSSSTGNVDHVFVTHLQEENAAGCAKFPGARIHIPAGDEYLCEGVEAYESGLSKWPPPWDWKTLGSYRGHVAGARNERPLRHPVRLSEPLCPGSSMLGFKIVATPGHGKNAMTLLAEINGHRVAFCGDLVCGDGQLWNWFDSEWDYGMESGARALQKSAMDLREKKPTLLCPTHGPVLNDPSTTLTRLVERLGSILESPGATFDGTPFIVTDQPGSPHGFRCLLPGLYQYARNEGNGNVLVSSSGNALMVDDGLCSWLPLPERAAHHQKVIADMKQALGIRRIEIVVPTHFHGDHIENIPALVEMEGCQVMCLDTVAEVIEHPERFNLSCPLPWYGTEETAFRIDRRVESGTRLRWQEFELEIFHLGGQTHYHAGIDVRIAGKRVLFVGDSFSQTRENPGPLCDAVLCYNDSDPSTRGWLYATTRMMERQPDLLVCGHAWAIRNPMPLLRRKQEAWQLRLARYRALSPRPDLREFFDPFMGA